MKSIFTLVCFVLCATLAAQERAEDETVLHSIRCEFMIARVSMAKGVALRKELQDPKTARRAYDKLIEWIENDQAELVDWPIVTTSGNQVSFKNTRVVRQPIQYELPKIEPAELKPKKEGPGKLEGNLETRPENSASLLSASADKLIPDEAKPATWAEAGPVNFLDEDIGVKFHGEVQFLGHWDEQFKSYRQDLSVIPVRLFASHRSLLGYRQERFVMKGGLTGMVEQPRIETRELSIDLTLKAGVPQMAGFFKLNEPKNTVELWVLSATAVETKFKTPKKLALPRDPTLDVPEAAPLSPIPGTDKQAP